jgi:hypothetical protein
MPRPTLALTGRLACLSGGLWSAVTRRCFELFSYVLKEIRQEVMQKLRFFVPKPRIAQIMGDDGEKQRSSNDVVG